MRTHHPPTPRKTSWFSALIFALTIHGLLGWIPLAMQGPPPPPPPLRIKLVARKQPPPPPPPRPIARPTPPVQPAPRKPRKRKPRKRIRRRPRPRPIARPIPRPTAKPTPRPVTPPAPQPAVRPEPIRPTPPIPPRAVTPPTPRPAAPVDLGPYRSILGRALEKHKRYPVMAQRMGLEGLVVILLRVTPKGSLARPPRILRSSGYGVLDQEAVRMVSAALPLPLLPSGYSRAWAEFRIPVRFALED